MYSLLSYSDIRYIFDACQCIFAPADTISTLSSLSILLGVDKGLAEVVVDSEDEIKDVPWAT